MSTDGESEEEELYQQEELYEQLLDQQERDHEDEEYEEDLWDEEERNEPPQEQLHDIYQIHSSNQQAWHNTPEFLNCPVCEDLIHISDISHHIVYYHSSFYLSMGMFMNPNITIYDIQTMIENINNVYRVQNNAENMDRTYSTLQTVQRLMFQDDDAEEPSYEDLLSLCDQIGYCRPGIKNEDEVAPIVEKQVLQEEERCCICLEGLQEADAIRKINYCQHMFCSPCILKWFEENRTCPLCNAYVGRGLSKIGSTGGLDEVD